MKKKEQILLITALAHVSLNSQSISLCDDDSFQQNFLPMPTASKEKTSNQLNPSAQEFIPSEGNSSSSTFFLLLFQQKQILKKNVERKRKEKNGQRRKGSGQRMKKSTKEAAQTKKEETSKSKSKGKQMKKSMGKTKEKVKEVNHSQGDLPANLSASITEKLLKNNYECLICYENLGRNAKIWSCDVCFVLLHLTCARKWAMAGPDSKTTATVDSQSISSTTNLSNHQRQTQIQSSQSQSRSRQAESSATSSSLRNWRCPGCQSGYSVIPNKFTCSVAKKKIQSQTVLLRHSVVAVLVEN